MTEPNLYQKLEDDPIVKKSNPGRTCVVRDGPGGRMFFKSPTNSISIERTKRIFNTICALSKRPHLHRAYVIGGSIFFWLAVFQGFVFLLLPLLPTTRLLASQG